MDERGRALELAREVRRFVQYLAALGVTAAPRVETPDIAPLPGGPAPEARAEAAFSRPELPPPVVETLDDIQADLGDCRRCGLCQSRTRIVFGQGPADARLMFVGGAPGEAEDAAGRPFAGQAGDQLTAIIEKGIKIKRSECYITDAVKCRPPADRAPAPEEAATCLPFLRRQIASVQPTAVVALGKVAANHLLGLTNTPLMRLRNRWHEVDGVPVMPTFHPAQLVEKADLKRPAWEDVKLVIDRLRG